MRTKWQGLGIMSQSQFIAVLTLKQTPINGNPVKANFFSGKMLYTVFARFVHHLSDSKPRQFLVYTCIFIN